jgi:ABC-2 type transport system permease protein
MHAGIVDPGVLTAVLGAGLYLTLIGLLGMFIGVLVRRTPGALAALFGLLVVPLIVFTQIPGKVTKNLGEYMPEAGERAFHLLRGGTYALGPWQGLGVEAAYVAVAAVAAFALILRRDALCPKRWPPRARAPRDRLRPPRTAGHVPLWPPNGSSCGRCAPCS